MALLQMQAANIQLFIASPLIRRFIARSS